MRTGQNLSMLNKSISVKFYEYCRLWVSAGLLCGMVLTSGYAVAEQPSLAEARAQAGVWQDELNKAVRSGNSAAAATAREEIRSWEAIIVQREAEAKREALLKEAREKADQADEIARLRGIKVPENLKGEQRVVYILRQDQIIAEKEKTAKEKAAQDALKGRLYEAITGGDYNATKGIVNQGAKPDIDAVQLAIKGGYTGIAYLLLKSNDRLPHSDVQKVLGKAMIAAAQAGDETRNDNLMKLNADPNFSEGNMTPMLAASRTGNLRIISTLGM